MKFKIFLSILITLVLINNVSSSILCDRTSLILNPSQTTDSFTCSNTDTQPLSISTNGYFTLNSNSISGNASQSFTATLNNAPSGYSVGLISFGSSFFIPVNVTMPTQTQEQITSGIITFPTSKVINVQQGQTKTQNIQVIIPGNYPTSVTIQSISQNPDIDIVKFGDLSLGIITPGTTVNVPIIIDASTAQTGTYSTQIVILATNSTGQVQLTPTQLSINIQSGINPVTNSTFTVKPTCSLSNVLMSLNQTYTFTCTNTQNNLDINPVYSEYFEGTNVDLTGNYFIYTFKPVKFGNPIFEATFLYKNSPIFSKYSQEVRISSSGLGVAGTDLAVIYTPSLSLAKPGESVILQVIDNKSNSLIDSELYIDAKQLNGTNSFNFNFEQDKNYSIRAKANGYSDFTGIISLTSQPISILLNPSSGDSNTQFNITTSVFNATLLIDGAKVINPYVGTLSSGFHEILAVKEGFYDTKINLTVSPALTASLSTIFAKGKPQIISLSNNASWNVYYQTDAISQKTPLLAGNSNSITFTPDKTGIYTIQSANQILGTYEVKGWDYKIFGIAWYFIVGGIILIIIIYSLSGKSSSSTNMPMGMGGNLNS